MKLIGEKIFAKNADGQLVSRIGTMFFRTPGLVTAKGVHAMQRLAWIEELSKNHPLSPEEEEAEMAESVDLIFTDTQVLIRPDPERMDLAFRADEELQKTVSKRAIRYLNTNSAKVRAALRERGENWRMARAPISQEDMADLIEKSRVAIGEQPIYYYNRLTGTRYLTVSTYDAVAALDDAAFRRQIAEIVACLNKRNRLGQPEVDIFPASTPPDIRRALKDLKPDGLDDAALRERIEKINTAWRMTLPAALREETTANFDWRNEMCYMLTRQPNDTNAEEQELIAGIAPEYYRQIEWLPGARIDDGEVIFDPLYDEAARTQDPELLALCDNRVKSIIFNATRLMGDIAYINIGRIAKSLSRHPMEGNRRGNVYIAQYRKRDEPASEVAIIRLQKWGVAERLDEGKGLLQAIVESDEYTDYILDRRLMCLQLGMNLPRQVRSGNILEKYRGTSSYNGCTVRTSYFVRAYVPGVASDKVPPARFRNAAFAHRFATLMGEAAAIDLIVGRRSTLTHEPLFDQYYEVLRLGADGLPADVRVTDHAGSFDNYLDAFETYVASYASVVTRRKAFVTDYAAFAAAYVAAFEHRLCETQAAYRARKHAFDELFADRPYDTNGSGAFRWASALRRLDACDPARIAALLKDAIGC